MTPQSIDKGGDAVELARRQAGRSAGLCPEPVPVSALSGGCHSRGTLLSRFARHWPHFRLGDVL